MTRIRVLCTGDLHIGRRSSKIPEALDGQQYSCAHAWQTVVELALGQRVDLVAVSGDLVDRDNRFYEAFGPLERGLRALARAGIPVYVVAGNHDFDVLPRLVETIGAEHVRLLGQSGRWERATFSRDGQPLLHLDGWSFPQEHVLDNPLSDYRPEPADGLPVLGLLHGDLDQAASRYGPVPLDDLQRCPVSLWLLGHVHRPQLHQRPGFPPVLYPGSPQAMDPGEEGPHGPWIVEFESGRVEPRQLLASTARYRGLTIDLSGLSETSALDGLLAEAVREALQRLDEASESSGLECLLCRITLTGRTPLHRRLPGIVGDGYRDLELRQGATTGVIERVIYATSPAVNLPALAGRTDPPGELARLLLALDRDPLEPECQELVSRVLERLRAVHGAAAYRGIAADPPPEREQARRQLGREAYALLDALLTQKEQP